MKIIKNDGSYAMVEARNNNVMLIYRVYRSDIDDYSKVCVGEVVKTKYDTYEVIVMRRRRRVIDSEPELVKTVTSFDEALDTLWEQRNMMHWGYYQ